MSRRSGPPLDDEELLLELPEGLKSIPLATGREAVPEDHLTFEGFWATRGKEDSQEELRLKELFFEWLGQNGYDVHHRDEPTVIGDRANWTRVFEHYLKVRRLK